MAVDGIPRLDPGEASMAPYSRPIKSRLHQPAPAVLVSAVTTLSISYSSLKERLCKFTERPILFFVAAGPSLRQT